ncbi:MAG: hypothetical protein ACFFAN_03365 [Promethearchaeota archaeon]
MLTESKRMNIAIVLFIIINIYGIIMGLGYAISGIGYEREIGMTSSQISNFNPRLMDFIRYMVRMTGFNVICISITNLFILNYSFRNKEKWAWIVLLITGTTINVAVLIGNYLFVGPLSVSFIILCARASLFTIAMGISYKEFFPKSKNAI